MYLNKVFVSQKKIIALDLVSPPDRQNNLVAGTAVLSLITKESEQVISAFLISDG